MWDSQADLQRLSQCDHRYKYQRRSFPEMHSACCLDVEQPRTNALQVHCEACSRICPPRQGPPRWPSGFKASVSRAADPGFDSRLRHGSFSGSSHTSDLKIGTPVANQPGAWGYRVSTGTGWPGVRILRLSEVERLICFFYLSVEARKLARADLFLMYTSMLLGR